jgi:hypothetical protein
MTFHPFRPLNSRIARDVSATFEPSSRRMISAFAASRSRLARQRFVTNGASWIGTTIDIDALASVQSTGCSNTLFRGKPRLSSLLLIRLLIAYMPSITTCGRALLMKPGRRQVASGRAEVLEAVIRHRVANRMRYLKRNLRVDGFGDRLL